MKKTQRNRKRRKKGSTAFYLFVLLVSFSVSTLISYLYFKPMLALESSLIKAVELKRDPGKTHKEEDQQRLYESKGMQSMLGWYDAEFRKDAVLVIAENVIKEQLRQYNVKLLDLYMDKEGIIYIDLSKDLRKNFKGGAFEEYRIIAGLYRKIRENVPNFTALKILIEGREVDSFGGHIDISRPIGGEIERNI